MWSILYQTFIELTQHETFDNKKGNANDAKIKEAYRKEHIIHLKDKTICKTFGDVGCWWKDEEYLLNTNNQDGVKINSDEDKED